MTTAPRFPADPTIRDLHEDLLRLREQLPSSKDSQELETITRQLKRQQRIWVPVAWLVGIVGTVFSAGMAAAVFTGQNATDSEVEDAIQTMASDHGADPLAHPDLIRSIEANGNEIRELKKQTKSMEKTQDRLDKRSLYQFEFSRWQAEVIECERRPGCRVPPRKPQIVKDLESDLMND